MNDLLRKYIFYAVDLNLYIDTHPNSKEAIEDYNLISSKICECLASSSHNSEPLMNFGFSKLKKMDKSLDCPWPWEKQANKEDN